MPPRSCNVFSIPLLPPSAVFVKAWNCVGNLGGIIVRVCQSPALEDGTLSAPLGII